MLYRFFQFILRRSFSLHYQNIKGFSIPVVPEEGPLIVAPIHPNSFLDALIVATQINRPLHFLARSDVFQKPWANFILRQLNLIPIYRVSEGSNNVHKNQDTFHQCYEILNKGGAILIFPEGKSYQDKQVHILKKGLPRIAMGFMEQNNFEPKLNIVPIGVNYEKLHHFNSNVLVGYGSPFTLAPWINEYKENQNQAYVKFNEYLHYALQKQVIQVNDENLDFYESICQLDPSYRDISLDRRVLIAKSIKRVREEQSEKTLEIEKLLNKTKKTLKKYHLEFKHLKHPIPLSVSDIISSILFLPLSIVALIINIWPYFLAQKLANELPKKHLQFYQSVRFVGATFIWLIWTIILTFVLLKFFGQWYIFTPIISYWSLLAFKQFQQSWRKVSLLRKVKKLKTDKTIYHDLIVDLKNTLSLKRELNLIPKDEL